MAQAVDRSNRSDGGFGSAADYRRLLETDSDGTYDAIAGLASRALDTPVALVTLVDDRRWWAKGRVGLELGETRREVSFCSHAIDAEVDVLVVPDATLDPRFAENPLVMGPPHIRSYAGVPMRAPTDDLLGTVCVIDHVPREFDADGLSLLTHLADQAVLGLHVRRVELVNRELAAAREEADRRFGAVFARSPAGMAVLGRDGRFVHANPILCRMLDRTPEELADLTIADVSHPDDRDADRDRVERVFAGVVDAYEFPVRHLLPDATVISVLLTLHADRDEEGGVRFVVARVEDRTGPGRVDSDRRAQLAALQVVRMELEDAVAARDQVLAMATHDMRNPLTVIRGHADLLTGPLSDGNRSDVNRSLEAISRQSRRLESLVDDLLALSSIEGGLALDVTSLDVADEVERIVGSNIGESPVTVVVDGRVDIAGDRRRFEQMLTNLLDNAERYGRPPVEIVITGFEGWVEVRVRDHGTGVPAEFVPDLFEKFSRARESVARTIRGSGLGLAIVRSLAQAHHGTAWYEDAPEGGACFVVRLPATRSSGNPTPSAVDRPPRGQVLVAGGNGDLVQSLDVGADYDVLVVDDLDRILTVCRRNPPDVIVLSPPMGEQDSGGLPFVRDALARLGIDPSTTDIPVLTVRRDRGIDPADDLAAGAADVVVLPVSGEELHARIRALVTTAARTEALKARAIVLDQESRTDALTGLSNRRSLASDFERLASYARRHGQPLAVLMIDVDRFKEINDRYGHLTGDRVLSLLGRAFASQRRTEDIAGRWGGDEFLVLAPGTDLDGASALAERIRVAVATADLRAVDPDVGMTLTVSIGIAPVSSDPDAALRNADLALYEAKRAGRDAVMVHRPA